MNQIIELDERESSLKTVGHVSYLLHLIVAVAAVMPGAQASIALLIVAFVIDLAKKDSAAGTWQESHFRWR
ncbi:MAG: putative rane protein, partial [Proteobacteria bacterium]|nr:putative rane protein [Pseudomonadota bacterium]